MELEKINHFCVKCAHCGKQAEFTTIVDNPSAFEIAQNIPGWVNKKGEPYCSYDCWAMAVISVILMPGKDIELMRDALKKALTTVWC
jgi:hypothetical protein